MPDDEPLNAPAGRNTPSTKIELPLSKQLGDTIKRIRDQTFLFVIALAIVIIMLIALGGMVGYSDMRFIVGAAVITLLAVIALFTQKSPSVSAPPRSGTEETPSRSRTRRAPPDAPQAPKRVPDTSAHGLPIEERREALNARLVQHERNLERLLQQRSVYATGEEPLRLSNQIDSERQTMDDIRTQIDELAK